jgi:NAD(P)-dependent dehydrogenase (short-subunit alcohol dehydrogenase family)
MWGMQDLSMQGRTCLITGASSGIGQATAAALATRGAHVVMAGRDPARTEAARRDVVERSGSDRVEVVLADLASLADVRKLAGEVRSRFEHLHVLINNAGVVTAERQLTTDGFETMFGVNHLAHYLLTLELLPLLKASAPARIVVVASDAHKFARFDLDDLQSEHGFGFPAVARSMRVYGGSKLANLLFAQALSRRLQGSGLSVNSVHPGAVATNMGENNPGKWYSALPRLLKVFFASPEKGATATLHAATGAEFADTSGAYIVGEKVVTPAANARDTEAAERLWQRSAELVGHSGDTPS